MNFEPEKSDEKKKKIILISEIDELKVIAHNHYLMGKYNEALKVAREIIELAKNADLNFIIQEQEKFITKIYQLVEKRDLKSFLIEDFEDLKNKFEKLLKFERIMEAHEIVEEFKQKYNTIIDLSPNIPIKDLFEREEKIWDNFSNEQNTIKKKLEPLEIQLQSYLSTNNVQLARDAFEKAKLLLKNLKDSSLLQRWGTMEALYSELKKKFDYRSEIESAMKDLTKLTDEYKFNQAKNLLKSINQIIEEKDFKDYKKDLKIKQRSILDAEQKYEKLLNDIVNLENLVEENIKNYLFDDAIKNCEQIIKIARFIGKENYVDKYSEYIANIKAKLQKYDKFENLRANIVLINEKALNALMEENFPLALSIFKEIREKLANFINSK